MVYSLGPAGAEGPLGYYDAVDYTVRRPDETGDSAAARDGSGIVVKTHMAHHQGMTLVAITNILLDAANKTLLMACQPDRDTKREQPELTRYVLGQSRAGE